MTGLGGLWDCPVCDKGQLKLRGNIRTSFWIQDLSSDPPNQIMPPGIDSDSYIFNNLFKPKDL